MLAIPRISSTYSNEVLDISDEEPSSPESIDNEEGWESQLYEGLGLREKLENCANQLPFLQSYKYSPLEDPNQFETTLAYRIGICTDTSFDHEIKFILPSMMFAEEKMAAVQSNTSALQEKGWEDDYLCIRLAKRIVHFMATPFFFIKNCFYNWVGRNRARKDQYLNSLMNRLSKEPLNREAPSQALKNEFEQFRKFSCNWPLKTRNLSCKQHLVNGLFYLHLGHHFDSVIGIFNQALSSSAPDSKLHRYAYAGLISVRTNEITEILQIEPDQPTNFGLLAARNDRDKLFQTMNQLPTSAETIALKNQLAREVVNPLIQKAIDFHTDLSQNRSDANGLEERMDRIFSLSLLEAPLMNHFFPAAKALQCNFQAWTCLVDNGKRDPWKKLSAAHQHLQTALNLRGDSLVIFIQAMISANLTAITIALKYWNGKIVSSIDKS